MFLGEPLSSLFAKEEGLVEVTASLLVMAAFFILADAPNIVSRCVLRGLGDVKVPAMIGIALSWVCTPPLMWLFGYELGLGALGSWLGLVGGLFSPRVSSDIASLPGGGCLQRMRQETV